MWRLKIAEGGGDPWLRTKNGHVGRQVWEFDAAAEPDPAVDAARRAFVERRHDLKHSANLLMRLQVRNARDTRLAFPPLMPPLRSPRLWMPRPRACRRLDPSTGGQSGERCRGVVGLRRAFD